VIWVSLLFHSSLAAVCVPDGLLPILGRPQNGREEGHGLQLASAATTSTTAPERSRTCDTSKPHDAERPFRDVPVLPRHESHPQGHRRPSVDTVTWKNRVSAPARRPSPSLAEGEDVRLDARIEECDLEHTVRDRPGLAHQLIEPWLDQRSSAVLTDWRGVSLDTLLADIETEADFALVHSYGGYSTNLPAGGSARR
jgi:hypothetical protein